MWKCPECNATIKKIYYDVATYAYEDGTAYLKSKPTKEELKDKHRTNIIEDYDRSSSSGDGEWTGDPTFRCTECNNEIYTEDLIWIPEKKTKTKKNLKNPEEKKEPEEPEETMHKIIKPEKKITQEQTKNNISSILCKKCKHLIIANTINTYETTINEELFICPQCGTQNSIEEFNNLLNNNFFNTLIPKHAPRKKIKSKSIASLGKSKSPIHT